MAISTDVPIYTTTLTSTTTSVVMDISEFQNYKNLKIVYSAQNSGGSGAVLGMRFNSDTGSNYSATYGYGTGSSYASGGEANQSGMSGGDVPSESSGVFSANTIYINNYSNTNMYKTAVMRHNAPGVVTVMSVGMWRSTAAITSITFYGATFTVGSTFSIYGIGSGTGGDVTTKATGGELFSDATYYYHVFKGSGVFKPLQSLNADILVVAGGGGSIGAGGGGGAGGLLGFTSQSLTVQPYTITVGAGGAKGFPGSGTPTNGYNSKFGSLTTALGGAYGAGYNNAAYIHAGSGGGSGGGASFNPDGDATNGTAGQGNAGSYGYQATGGGDPRSGGGGGGAGGAAPSGSANTGGNGGIGATYNSTVGGSAGPYAFINAMGAATGTGELSGGNYYYAGGGGGEGKNVRGAAGLGGGGRGGTSEPAQYPDAGMANTGGGAGAGPNASSSYGGANGGSGIVIVRYAK